MLWREFQVVFATVSVVVFVFDALGADYAGQCGPFGDTPAVVNRGWLARFSTRHTPICLEGTLLGPWRDWSGEDRYACRYGPNGTRDHPLPLVVFLHGVLAAAAPDSILLTQLVAAAGKTDLCDGPGFVLLAPQGRHTLHLYPGLGRTGFGWDNWYRQFNPAGPVTIGGRTCLENPDAAAIDN